MARILVITPSYDPRLGGVEKHVWYTSQLLQKRGYSVKILTQRFEQLPFTETKAGIPISRFDFPTIRFLGLLTIWWQLFWRYRKLIQEADIIHIHDVFIWYLPLRLLFWRKPVITTFHGWEGIFPIPRKNILIRQLAARLSEKTVAIGRYLEKYYHFTADEVLYGGVELPRRLGKKEALLLFIGRLEYDTGLPVLLQALQQHPWPGRVIFCGDGLLKDQAALYGQVTGFRDPRPYLRKAKAVFAGGYLSILEAFAYRCSVAAAEKNPLKKDYYLLSPFAPWLSVTKTAAALSHWLKQAAQQPPAMRQLQRQAFEWVKTQGWEAVADRYTQLYQTVLHR